MPRHHRIDYLEIAVTDLAAAKKFYASAFGWRFTDYGPGYSGIQGDEREQGGLALLEEGKSVGSGGGPLAILYSDALDDTLAAVEGAGGTISTPPFDFPGGRRFHFADPFGNELAVWTQHSE